MFEPRNFRIDNVTLNWAKLASPVSPFGTAQYEMQIEVSKEQAQSLKDNHLNVKEKDGKFTVSLKRKAVKADGSDNGMVRVVNADASAMSVEDMKKIGNGSKGNVIVFQYEYNAAGRTGIASSLTAVQVTDLVEYVSTGGADFAPVEVADAPAEPTNAPF